MTLMAWDGPDWFARLFPLGMSVSFGPGCETRFTALEAAVFALRIGQGRGDEWILEDVPVTGAVLARIKAALQRKYEAWLAGYAASRGLTVYMPGRLFR